jgi:phosphatidylcholine synthase
MSDITGNTYPPATALRRMCAWGVHLFTASGAVWGLLSILAIQQQQYKLLLLWIALAMFADGFDGMLARRAHTKVYAAELDGGLLDNILDYLNYVVVAALMLIESRLLPQGWGIPVAALVMLASAFQFSQVEAKEDTRTGEHFFKGFPSYWNILAIYLLMLGLNPWINLVFVLVCLVLVFVPIKFIYPSRTTFHPRVNKVVMVIWSLTGLWMLIQFPSSAPGWVIGINLLAAAAYVGLSLASTLRRS